MSSENNSYKTQVMVALIGVVGALGAGLLANWDKVFPPAKEPATAVLTSNSKLAADVPPAVTPSLNQAGPAAPPVIENIQPQYFTGTFVGVSTEGVTQSPFQTTFLRHGNTVKATYIQNGMQGTIRGTVNGKTLHYQWSLGDTRAERFARCKATKPSGHGATGCPRTTVERRSRICNEIDHCGCDLRSTTYS